MSKIKLIVAWAIAVLVGGSIFGLFFFAMYKAISGYKGSLVDFGIALVFILISALMHEMPDEWQGKMADLMDEWHEVYTNMPDIATSVCAKQKGKFIKIPSYFCNYRHPNKAAINSLKSRATIEGE